MKFWQKTYLCVILIFLAGFDTTTYLSISKSYSLNMSAAYSAAENERNVIQSSLRARIADITPLYHELNAENLKMYVEPYGGYYNGQKTYMEVYFNNALVYSNYLQPRIDRPELQIEPGQKSTITRTVDGITYYFITGYLGEPYSGVKFVYVKDIQALTSFKNEMIRHAILSSVVVFIFFSVVLLAMLLKLTDPIRKLNQGAEEITAGLYQKRVQIKSRDEIGELTSSFNKMADSVENHIHRLSELTEARQQFINNLAHEMRTPLTAVLGYGESLKYANLTDDQRLSAINYIISQSDRMKSMAGKLMDLASLTAVNIRFEKIDLKTITAKVESSLSQKIVDKNIKIVKSFKGSQILGDKDLIESLIQNIMENAVQALPHGGIIALETFEKEKILVFAMKDNGIGMSDDDLKRVFEPFYRADKSRSRANGGAGLGLALCKQICDLHGALIGVTSEYHSGTIFEIKFTTLPHLDDNSAK
jgi:signal transduction histidine kinase